MNVCSIIAKNYVAQARVLAQSFKEHNPDGRFWTLIIDDYQDHVDPDEEPFEILTPTEIGCEPFEAMAARYDVLELSTAVKPWLLRYLLRLTSGPVTYLDPDIRVFGSLALLDELASQHGIVLTPHNTRGIPDDGKKPSQIDILIAGVYNLGYLSIAPNPETEAVIGWWMDRLTRDCRVDPVYGYFVDQRWFDLVPGLVSDYCIMRDPGYNLAYWNLHDHKLTAAGDSYKVDGHPLRFFHFSGYDPAEPGLLSRHQTRICLSDEPVLQQLCDAYAREVIEAGYHATHEWSYSFDRLTDGTRFTSLLRRLYAQGEDAGELSTPPFTPEGTRRFMEWLEESPEGFGLNRVLAAIYQFRVDLQRAYPDVSGADREGFIGWVKAWGGQDLELPPHLLSPPPSIVAGTPNEEPDKSRPWGVNVVGYFQSELGMGEAGRQVLNALDAVGVNALPIHGHTIPPSQQRHYTVHLDPVHAAFPVNVICMNADVLPELAHQTAAEGLLADRYSIGLWFWELGQFPNQWLSSFQYLQEIWAPTRFIAATLSEVSPIPVVHMPIPVEMPPVAALPREAMGLPDGFLFLFVFDYFSVFKRKNPLAIIDAFSRAFPNEGGPSLIMKCINAQSDPYNHERLKAAVAERADVYLIEESLSPEAKNGLIAACDCYVSLHRSEGFGLTMAEAMLLQKPVIATGYSGNMDFMNQANSYLVGFEMVPVGRDAAPYPPESKWAEPDLEHAASLMRAIFAQPATAAERGARGAAEMAATHSARVAGERMAKRLEAVRDREPAAALVPPDGPDRAGPPAARIARGVAPYVQRSRLLPRGLLRRFMLRLMKPFTAYQATLNEELVRAIRELNEDLIAYVRTNGELTGRSRTAILRSETAILAGLRAEQRALRTFEGKIRRSVTELQGRTELLMAWRPEVAAHFESDAQFRADVAAHLDVAAQFRVNAVRQFDSDAQFRADVAAELEALAQFGADAARQFDSDAQFRPDVTQQLDFLAEFKADVARQLDGFNQFRADVARQFDSDTQFRVDVKRQFDFDTEFHTDVARRLNDVQSASVDVALRLNDIQSASAKQSAWRRDVVDRIDALDRISQVAEAEAQAIPQMEGSRLERYRVGPAGIVEGYIAEAEVDRLDGYRSFADVFRGSEQLIAGRQRVYMDVIGSRAPVLDFGCGRGEFLDLLNAQAIPYVGVDSDEGMVRHCREKGHSAVVLEDGLHYLRGIEDQSIGAVFCAQVIEHLSYKDLLEFLTLSRRKIKDDGILIVETVNPHSRQALKTFWVDLSHQRPIFPEVALVLCRNAGFDAAYFFHPNGTGDVDRDRFVQGEYAVVAGAGDVLLCEPVGGADVAAGSASDAATVEADLSVGVQSADGATR